MKKFFAKDVKTFRQRHTLNAHIQRHHFLSVASGFATTSDNAALSSNTDIRLEKRAVKHFQSRVSYKTLRSAGLSISLHSAIVLFSLVPSSLVICVQFQPLQLKLDQEEGEAKVKDPDQLKLITWSNQKCDN